MRLIEQQALIQMIFEADYISARDKRDLIEGIHRLPAVVINKEGDWDETD